MKKRLIVGVCVGLGLVGCEAITDYLPPLPGLNTQITKQRPSVAVQSPSIAAMETAVQQQINKIRTSNNLKPLQSNQKLAQVAREYSRKMARENFFSHTSPQGDTPSQRVRTGGIFYIVVGENLFKSTNAPHPVPLAVEGWMDSPGHRENILRPEYRETGVGVWRSGSTYYITQLFLRSLIPSITPPNNITAISSK